MAADHITDGMVDGALQVVLSLLPACSVAAGVLAGPARSMRVIGALGPESATLLDGRALTEAYRAMSEHSTLTTTEAEEGTLEQVLYSVPIRGRDRHALGALQVLVHGQRIEPAQLAMLDSLTDLMADALTHRRLNLDLRHSLNQLFLVYEVGRLFNLVSSLDEVLQQVRHQLAGTLNFHHCCIMLLSERKVLIPEAGIGIDAHWLQEARPSLRRSVAARVLESGVAEQVTDPVELAGMDTPTLETGLPPEAVLCAPLSTRMGIIGVLELYTPTPYAFSGDEVFLLSVLAAEIATAVENSQLYISLREKEGRLTVLAHKLIHSQEEERRRIARDMHDGLAQMLVSAYQYLQAHAFTVPNDLNRDSLDRGMAVLTECIDESRNVIFDLRPSTLDDFGLVLALQQYLSRLEAELGWQIEFSLIGQVGPMPAALETAIFRMVKEALTNVRKHAQTQKVLVRLAAKAGTLIISVEDWGTGFNTREVASRRNGRLGLIGMKERVSLLNGTFQVRSRRGAGTLVRITIPLE